MSKSPKTIFVLLIFLVVAMSGMGLGEVLFNITSDFSGTQGNNNIWYMQKTGTSTYSNLTLYNATTLTWSSTGFLFLTNGTSGGTGSNLATYPELLVMYKSEETGQFNLTFGLRKPATMCSPEDGIHIKILNSTYGVLVNKSILCSVGTYQEISINKNLTYGENVYYYVSSNGGGDSDSFDQIKMIANKTATSGNLYITSKNLYNNQSITNFSALINGTTYSTTNGTINTGLPSNSTELFNITISSNESGGYFNQTYSNYNISNDLSSYLTPLYYLTASYSGNQTYNSTDYARNLSYSLTYTCPTTQTAPTIDIYINGVYNSQRTFSCFDTATLLTGSYQHATEGQYNISFYYNTSYLPEFNSNFTGNQTFVSDLNNPTPTTNITIGTGFTSANANITLTCSDSIMYGNLTYNLTFNGVNQFYGIKTNGTTQTNQTVPIDGTNTLIGKCSDLFGTSTSTTTQSTYTNTIYLIDEKTNSAFNVQNISGVKVFYDDNSTSYDFKAANTSILNFTALTTSLTKLRFELTYPSGDVVTRYVDMALVDGDLRVCANKDGVLHYAQLITSATNRAAVLKNVYSNCVVAQDYTRFTYQDTNVLRAFTIDSLYYLYTNVDGVNSYLASLDGGIASTYYNLDVLEFNAQRSDLDIIKSVITTEKTGENTTKILYLDFENDSVSTNMMVYRVNGSVLLTNITETSTPNEFYLTFDYTLLNITNGESFKIVVIKTLSSGSTVEATAYFNTDGSYGFLSPAFVFVLSILLVIFGLTFLSTKESMGWFGIAIMVAAVVVLALAPLVWYTAFLMTIEIIILLFIVILLVIQNYQTVT